MQTSITDQPQDSSLTWAYNGPRRVPVSPSRRRALLFLAAVLFGGATAFYSIFWMYYAPQGGATRIGAEFAYSLKSRALRVTRKRLLNEVAGATDASREARGRSCKGY